MERSLERSSKHVPRYDKALPCCNGYCFLFNLYFSLFWCNKINWIIKITLLQCTYWNREYQKIMNDTDEFIIKLGNKGNTITVILL